MSATRRVEIQIFDANEHPLPKTKDICVRYSHGTISVLKFVGEEVFGKPTWDNEHGLSAHVEGDEPDFDEWFLIPEKEPS